jgi:hypothetical protein
VPGKYVAGARKVCRGHHGARGRRVGQACYKGLYIKLQRRQLGSLRNSSKIPEAGSEYFPGSGAPVAGFIAWEGHNDIDDNDYDDDGHNNSNNNL